MREYRQGVPRVHKLYQYWVASLLFEWVCYCDTWEQAIDAALHGPPSLDAKQVN